MSNEKINKTYQQYTTLIDLGSEPVDLLYFARKLASAVNEQVEVLEKQIDLLDEDATIMTLVKQAPARRVFYVDVGAMPPEEAKKIVEDHYFHTKS